MAEAAIAFTGLAASLITLLALVNDSCRTVNELYDFYEDAPTILEQLRKDLSLSKALVKAIASASQTRGSQPVPTELQKLWHTAKNHMSNDFKDLQTEVTRVRGRSRVKLYFAQDRIAKAQSRISRHIDTLQLIKTLTISDQIANIDGQVILISKAISDLPVVLGSLLPSQPSTQVVPTSSPRIESDNSPFFKTVLPENWLHSPKKKGNTISNFRTSRRLLSYSLFVGELQIESSQIKSQAHSLGLRCHENDSDQKFKVIFVPLPWFSNISVETTFSFISTVAGRLPGFAWSLNTSTIHILPIRKNMCPHYEENQRWRPFEEHECCEYDLYDLCCKRDVLATDKVMWRSIDDMVSPQCLLAVLQTIFLRQKYYQEDTKDVMQASWDLLNNQNRENMIDEDMSKLIENGFLKPSTRAAQFSRRMLVAGATMPPLPDLSGTLRKSVQWNYEEDYGVMPGLRYIEETGPFFDIGLFWELDDVNVWILACLARAIPAIHHNILRQVQDFGFQGSSKFRWFDVQYQIDAMINSEPSNRIECLTSLAAGGTALMLGPLLSGGVDVDKKCPEYLKVALTGFNYETALTILENTPSCVNAETFRFLDSQFIEDEDEDYCGGWLTMPMRLVTCRGEHFVRFFEYLMGKFDFNSLGSEDVTLPLAVRFLAGFILPGPVHNTKFYWMKLICESRHYDQWPMQTGVRVVEILLRAGILRDGHLYPPIQEQSFGEKKFGHYWVGSPILTAMRYYNESQLKIIKLFVQHGYDLDEEDRHGRTALMWSVQEELPEVTSLLIKSMPSLMKPSSKGVVPWRFLMSFVWWFEDSNTDEELRLNADELQRFKSLVMDKMRLGGRLTADEALRSEKRDLDDIPKEHILPDGWHFDGLLSWKQSTPLLLPIFWTVWYERDKFLGVKALIIISVDCPCNKCLLSRRQGEHGTLPEGWSMLPWPEYQTSDFDMDEKWFTTELGGPRRSGLDISCPCNPTGSGSCSYYHIEQRIAFTHRKSFATACYELPNSPDEGGDCYYYQERTWWQRDSKDGKYAVSSRIISFPGYRDSQPPQRLCSLIPFYVNEDSKRRTWDCPCLECCARGKSPVIEQWEEVNEGDEEKQEPKPFSDGAAQERPWESPSTNRSSYPYNGYICSRCLKSDQTSSESGSKKRPKLDHWIPRNGEECKILCCQIRDALIKKVNVSNNDNTIDSQPLMADKISALDAVIGTLSLFFSICLVLIFEGFKILRVIHRLLWSGEDYFFVGQSTRSAPNTITRVLVVFILMWWFFR